MKYKGWVRCFRCNKKIMHPNALNSDYIIAPDTIVNELVDVLIALTHNQETLAKAELEQPILDDEYTETEVYCIDDAVTQFPEDLVKVIADKRDKDIQKTGIICDGCLQPTDIIIWGIHK